MPPGGESSGGQEMPSANRGPHPGIVEDPETRCWGSVGDRSHSVKSRVTEGIFIYNYVSIEEGGGGHTRLLTLVGWGLGR